MKQSHQIAILAAVGIGAFFLLRGTATAGGVGRTGSLFYPSNAGVMPQPGTPAYTQYMAQQQMALDNARLGAIYGIGKTIGNLFGGTSSNNTGSPYVGGSANTGGVREIANNDVPGQPGYGWKYYSDGTSIGPDGTYYNNSGQIVYTPQDGQAVNPPFNASTWDPLAQEF